MKSLVKWCVALAAVAGLVTLAGAWSSQDSGKKATGAPAVQKPLNREAAALARKEHMAALMKALPTLKTPLSEAITIAEKERKGKAHGADVELGKDGKLKIEIRLLVGDKFEEVYVDHETKKVIVPEKGKGHEDGDDDDDDDDDEGR